MNFKQLINTLKKYYFKDPIQGQNTEQELTQSDVIPFLESTIEGDIPVYISSNGFFVYSIAVPINELPANFSELPEYSVTVVPHFCISQSYRYNEEPQPDDFSLSHFKDSNEPEYLGKGTPLTTSMSYMFNENKNYIEFPQDLTQPFGLHRDDETGNFCRIDNNGDKEIICNIRDDENGKIVTIRDTVLFAYLCIKKCILIRVFHCTRSNVKILPYKSVDSIDRSLPDKNIFAKFYDNRHGDEPYTYLKGGQVVGLDRIGVWEKAKQELAPASPQKEYCDYIIYDWKNKKIATCSCSPESTSNYFEPPNPKPFDLSPAFFNPKVMNRYKSNPAEYVIESRRITKIDAWSLQTYDIIEDGQVHTYLCYLRTLPYDEQLYWKSCNEEPKGDIEKGLSGVISKRALETDFKGEWSEIRRPNENLICLMKEAITDLPFIFTDIQEEELQKIHPVHTDNEKEWGDEIGKLDKLIVESLNLKNIQTLAGKIDCLDKNLKSLKQLEAIIKKIGCDSEVLTPLFELHGIRDKISGHKQGTDAKNLKKDIRKRFGSYPAHFDNLLIRICEFIRSLLRNKDSFR